MGSIEEKDAPPIEEKDASPIGEKDAPPIDEKDAPSIEAKDASPIQAKDTAPIEEKDTPPIEAKNISPIDAQATSPSSTNTALTKAKNTSSIEAKDVPGIEAKDLPGIEAKDVPGIEAKDIPPMKAQLTSVVEGNNNITHAASEVPAVCMYVMCRINGHSVQAALNTGHHWTIMTEQCAKRLNIHHLVDKRLSLKPRYYVERKVQVIGQIHLYYVYINNVKLQISIVIVKEMQMDLVLGLNLLQRYHCTINLQKDSLIVSQVNNEILYSVQTQDKTQVESSPNVTEKHSYGSQDNISQEQGITNAGGIKKSLGEICSSLRINCVVNGVDIIARVDTSCSTTYMSERCAEKCNVKHCMETSSPGGSSSGESSSGISSSGGSSYGKTSSGERSSGEGSIAGKIIGYIRNGSIQINSCPIPTTFTIRKFNPHFMRKINPDLILGADFLRQHHCTLDMLRHNMIIGAYDVKTCLLEEREILKTNKETASTAIMPEDEIKRQQILTNRETKKWYYPSRKICFLFVDCFVNGQPVKALLDTGAPSSNMSESFAVRAGLAEIVDPSYSSIVTGTSGKACVGRVHYCPFHIKDTLMKRHWRFDVVKDPFVVDFQIGLDLLDSCTIDLLNSKLIIGDTVANIIRDFSYERTPSICQTQKISPDKSKIDATKNEVTQALRGYHCTFGHRYIRCSVNNVPVIAVVDTGSMFSAITAKCAKRCGVLDLLDKEITPPAVGFVRRTLQGRIDLCPIQVKEDILHETLWVMESPFEVLIGLDILSKHNCVINLKDNLKDSTLVISNTGTKTVLMTD